MVNDLLDGRYEVLRELGAGGMGVVYLVRDRTQGVDVALKLLRPELLAHPEVVRRFEREFEACRRLDHPGVVKLLRYGRLPAQGGLYYTMEYLPEPSLAHLLRRRGRLSADEALPILRGAAEALAYLHARGLVHRDVKPANIVVGEGGRTVLVDFGLARDLWVTQMTKTGTTLGTPAYYSPELVRGADVDGRSDVYQLGAVAFELLSGRRASGEGTIGALAARILHGPRPDLAAAASDVPAWLVEVVQRCLARAPGDRYPTAGALALALRHEEAEVAPRGATRPAGERHPTAAAPAVLADPESGARERRGPWAALLGAALLVAAAAWPWPAPPRPEAAPEPATAAAPLVAVVGAERLPGDAVRLTWRGPPPSPEAGPWRLSLLADGLSDLTVTGRSAPDGTGEVVVPALPPSLRDASLLLDGREAVSLARSLERQITELGRSLAALRPQTLVAEVIDGLFRPPETVLDELVFTGDARRSDEILRREEERLAEVRSRWRPTLRRRLGELPATAAYLEAVRLSRLAFGTRLLSPDRRLRFYARLAPWLELRQFDAVTGLGAWELPWPELGEFALSLTPAPGAAEERVLFESPDSPLRLGVSAIYTPKRFTPSWSATFTLGAPEAYAAAELAFAGPGFADMVLRVRLNDGPDLTVHDRPLLEHEGPAPLYQRFPVTMLRAGPNALRLSPDPLMGRAPQIGRAIELHRVALRLVRR